MSSYSVPETITYGEALKITLFKKAIDLLDGLIQGIDTPAERKAILGVFTGEGTENYETANQRTDHPFIDYKRPGTMVPRDATKDRVFPLEPSRYRDSTGKTTRESRPRFFMSALPPTKWHAPSTRSRSRSERTFTSVTMRIDPRPRKEGEPSRTS